jgi:hypothetical protein
MLLMFHRDLGERLAVIKYKHTSTASASLRFPPYIAAHVNLCPRRSSVDRPSRDHLHSRHLGYAITVPIAEVRVHRPMDCRSIVDPATLIPLSLGITQATNRGQARQRRCRTCVIRRHDPPEPAPTSHSLHPLGSLPDTGEIVAARRTSLPSTC